MGNSMRKRGKPDSAATRPPVLSNTADRNLALTILLAVVRPLASLRLTVVLFSMSIFLLLTGTFAQEHMGIWEVVHGYFRAKIAWIDFQVLFPSAFYAGDPPKVRGSFPFPGGFLIGCALAVNLFAAHLVRFKVQARGARLYAGIAVLIVGVSVTWLVVDAPSVKAAVQSVAGSTVADGLMGAEGDSQGGAAAGWGGLWLAIKIGLFFGLLASAATAILLFTTRAQHNRRAETWLSGVGALLAGNLLLWILMRGDDYLLGDSSMRILWELIKGELVALILLSGCILAFKRRAGIVLIHAGVALVMLNEIVVHSLHTEASMQLYEGQAVNFVQDARQCELAVTDESDEKTDDVTAVPKSRLLGDKTIQDEHLPFDIKVVEFQKNSRITQLAQGAASRADKGHGRFYDAKKVRAGAGTDTGGTVDMPSAYVELFRKDTTDSLGTYLLSLFLKPDTVTIDDKEYRIELRHKRIYKTYSILLTDVRADQYQGTQTTRNFSSDIRLIDPTRNVDRNVKIWMNNPLRFAGETFYQQNYERDRSGREITVLQVVSNTGWMIPYVACMIVGTGMLAQFLFVLLRFLNRTTREIVDPVDVVQAELVTGEPLAATSRWNPILRRWFPLAVVLLMVGYLGGKLSPPRESADAMQVSQFRKLPLRYEGRIKPYDTVARNTLMIISGKQSYVDEKGNRQPAIRWLLDEITGSDDAEKHKVFRIENLEVLGMLGLKRRSGFRYALEEFKSKVPQIGRQADLARAKEANMLSLSVYDKKIVELAKKLQLYHIIHGSLSLPRRHPSPEQEMNAIRMAYNNKSFLASSILPQPLPMRDVDDEWEPGFTAGTRNWLKLRAADRGVKTPMALAEAIVDDYRQDLVRRKIEVNDDRLERIRDLAVAIDELMTVRNSQKEFVRHENLDDPVDPAAESLINIYSAYAENDSETFNDEIARYQGLLAESPQFKPLMPQGSIGRIFKPASRFEAYFNHVEPFFYCSILYLAAFLLAPVGWLLMLVSTGWARSLNRASFWLIVVALVVHSLALAGRMFISGRPPVTNLYSSAVFIGWATVVFGIVFEVIYRIGIGNVIAGVSGFAALLIAHFLAGDGDTLKVLVAVLDTQFWLATHVVCVTIGYATTFVAGLLGMLYIFGGVLTPALSDKNVDKTLSSMIYGTVCFALFFSFIGTVLGGLWADDSWGRFWGWDPKENGALIIVLWNAIVLHSRWGGLVRGRGLAMLAVGGNIATSWSWFGVNELGIGLHSYGFTQGVLLTLGVAVVIHLAWIGLGAVPQHLWISIAERKRVAEALASEQFKRRKKS